MKKVLVVGATGFLGTKLIPELIKKYDVTCMIRKKDSNKLLNLKNKIKITTGDMLNKESVERSLKKIEVVIHLATPHVKGKNEFNFIGSKNIVESCKKFNVKKIIFISSMAVKRKKLDEYGKIKLRIEKLIENSGLNYVIIRPSMIYDENNLSLIGTSIKSFPFIIPVIGNGNYKLNPVYINDVVKTICKVTDNEKSLNKIYDIAGPEKLSFNEIINICKKQFKIKKIIIRIPIIVCLFIFKLIPIISIETIRGINEDTNADTIELEKDTGIKLTNFREGIKNANL